MDIIYLGISAFRIKGKSASVVTDPFSPSFTGLKFPKTEADIVTISHDHQDHSYVQGIEGEPFVINNPGEYEINGVSIFGFSSLHNTKSHPDLGKNIIYLIEMDGVRICHLGDLGSSPASEVLEEIIETDILMIPVGGDFTAGPKEAADIVGKIEPKIIIPMHYKLEGMAEGYAKLSSVEDFVKEMGLDGAETLDKLAVNKDRLPQETKIIILEKKS